MAQWIITALTVLAVLIVFFLIVMIVDGNRFRIVKYQLCSNKVKEEHRYVVLSDLHNKSYGEKNEKLLKSIDKLAPEAVLIAGDILTAKPGKSYEATVEMVADGEGKAQFNLHFPQR